MIDAPGPWATGPFTLVEGYSVIDTEQAVITREPFACTWLQREDRTPRVRLVANPNYWNRIRGPRLHEIVFRNDLSVDDAVDLVCDTEGEVDLVTEVPPAAASRVEASAHARLVAVDAVRALVGVVNRDAEGLPLHDRRARQALNLAVDRSTLVREVFAGHARPLAGLTPPTRFTIPHRIPDRLSGYRHDPARAAALWRESTTAATRPLRLSTISSWEAAAQHLARDLRTTLRLDVEITVVAGDDEQQVRRQLAEKVEPLPWDLLLLEHGSQSVDVPPLELHRAFVGASGEFRAGPILAEFERLFDHLVHQRSQLAQVMVSNRIDRYVTDQALALFLCAPDSLYAVNRHVDFVPYATTFELAETSVHREHWSRR